MCDHAVQGIKLDLSRTVDRDVVLTLCCLVVSSRVESSGNVEMLEKVLFSGSRALGNCSLACALAT